jgi:ribosome maturation factor RimP
MSNEEKTLIINSLVERLLEPETAIFLVRVHIRPINNISVYIDGDEGVTIDKCVKLNRALYKLIVEEEVCKDGEFGLEVSSPGVDEPLTMLRQYKKNLGRLVEVECADGKKVEGKLLGADETGIEVEEEKGKGKKKEIVKHEFSFAEVKSTVVKIVF